MVRVEFHAAVANGAVQCIRQYPARGQQACRADGLTQADMLQGGAIRVRSHLARAVSGIMPRQQMPALQGEFSRPTAQTHAFNLRQCEGLKTTDLNSNSERQGG